MVLALASAVDVKRKPQRRWRRWTMIGTSLALMGVGLTWLLAGGGGGQPRVSMSELSTETVRQSPLVRAVQARGTLVPETVHWVTATGPASVNRIVVRAGAAVDEGDVLVELYNADLELAALEAERVAAGARTTLATLAAESTEAVLAQRAKIARLEGDATAQRASFDITAALAARGLASQKDAATQGHQTRGQQSELAIEQKRRRALEGGYRARTASHEQELDKLVEVARFRRAQLDALSVRAPTAGVIQALPLEPGQWVAAGTVLAKVAKPGQLKAVLHVPEAQASDVAIGQSADIELFRATIAGKVMRVDPTVTAGTVRVEVALEGEVPEGARADVGVTGTIQLERIDSALVLKRPAGVVAGGMARMFRVSDDGEASAVSVRFGRASVQQIEVVSGLREGDTVLVGDLDRFGEADELRLED